MRERALVALATCLAVWGLGSHFLPVRSPDKPTFDWATTSLNITNTGVYIRDNGKRVCVVEAGEDLWCGTGLEFIAFVKACKP